MNINSAFPSKYLKASDAEEGDLLVTVARVKVENVGAKGKDEQKPVIYFTEHEKGMVLNKTNAKMISKIAKSEDTDDWAGTKLRIIATEVEFQGDLVMSLRVREVKRASKEAPADLDAPAGELNDSDIPF